MCGESMTLDSKVSDATRLMFVTTGVLPRRLMNDPDFSGQQCGLGFNGGGLG